MAFATTASRATETPGRRWLGGVIATVEPSPERTRSTSWRPKGFSPVKSS